MSMDMAVGFRVKRSCMRWRNVDFAELLVEGGAYTVSRFFEEGQLDRLHILLAPVLLGDGKAGFLQVKPPPNLAAATRVEPDFYALGGGDVLIDCPLR